MFRSRYAAALAAAWLSLAGAASGDTSIAGVDSEYLGIFADVAGTQTCVSVPPGTSTTLYLFAFPGGAVADGITGIEFRIVVVNPSGYFFFYTAPAGVPVVLGDPLDLQYEDNSARGAILAYGTVVRVIASRLVRSRCST